MIPIISSWVLNFVEPATAKKAWLCWNTFIVYPSGENKIICQKAWNWGLDADWEGRQSKHTQNASLVANGSHSLLKVMFCLLLRSNSEMKKVHKHARIRVGNTLEG